MDSTADIEPPLPDEAAGISLGFLAGSLGYRLRRAWYRAALSFAGALEGMGLRQVPFGILSVVAANPGIKQGAVAEALGIQRSNMVALVNELQERGWLERTPDPADRRAVTLRLTADGAQRFDEAVRRIRAHEARLLKALGHGEAERLEELLRRFAGG